MVYRAHWIRKQIFLAAFRDLFIWLHFRQMQKSIKHSHSNRLVLCSFQFIIISCCHSKTEYSWQSLHNRCEIWMEVSAVWSILDHSSILQLFFNLFFFIGDVRLWRFLNHFAQRWRWNILNALLNARRKGNSD